MIQNTTPTATGTITQLGQTVNAKFDLEAMETFIAKMLSDIYTQGEDAVLREYSANALDSHRQAGNDQPIDVTLPTELKPELVITDYGVGLSRDEVRDVFYNYGTSTKRESNDFIGSFGIGSKSAFAITSQFVITAVKDGKKTSVVFQIDGNVPKMNILGCEDTDEPNGVQVKLDANPELDWPGMAYRTFRTWERGTVLVDGKEPQCIWDGAEEISEGFFVTPERTEMLVSVGGIGYAIGNSILGRIGQKNGGWSNLLRSGRIVLDVPVGSVDIAPSREALKDSDRTINKLAEVVQAGYDTLMETITKEIDSAESVPDKMKARQVWVEKFDAYLDIEEPKLEEGQSYYFSIKNCTSVFGGLRATRVPEAEIRGYSYALHAMSKWIVITTTGKVSDYKLRTYITRYRRANDGPRMLIANADTEWGGWLTAEDFDTHYTDVEFYEMAKDIPSNNGSTSSVTRNPVKYIVHTSDGTGGFLTVDEIKELDLDPKEVFYGGSSIIEEARILGLGSVVAIDTSTSYQSFDTMVKRVGVPYRDFNEVAKKAKKAFLAKMKAEKKIQGYIEKRWLERNEHNRILRDAEGRVAKWLERSRKLAALLSEEEELALGHFWNDIQGQSLIEKKSPLVLFMMGHSYWASSEVMEEFNKLYR